MQHQFSVSGTVSQIGKAPVPGVIVRAFDKDLPSLKARGLDEQQLGEDALTDSGGRYQIAYADQDFRRGETRARRKMAPDIIIRVFDGDTLLGESNVLYNAPAEATIDLTVSLPDKSEFERLLSDLTPALQGVALADLTDADLAFLAADAELGLKRLRLLRKAAQFERQTGVPTEVFYGLVHEGLPHVLHQLLSVPNKRLRDALTSAISGAIIPASLKDQIVQIISRLRSYNYVLTQATAQLLDQASGAVLKGYTVRVFDLAASPIPKDLGAVKTDGQGLFALSYLAPPTPDKKAVAHKFLLKISTPEGKALSETEVSTHGTSTKALLIRVRVPAAQVPPSPAMPELAKASGLNLPKKLSAFLKRRNIKTLADIRQAGGLSRLKGLPLPADHPAVLTLEAYADLGRLSSDLKVSVSLIKQGFNAVSAIAARPRPTFVAATHKAIGDFQAAKLHVIASAQTAYLDNLIAEAAANQANGFKSGAIPNISQDDVESLLAMRCGCEDCESAASPASYLRDLIDYGLKNLTDNGGPVTVAFLTKMLYQPFADLPFSCRAVEKPVRQVRICIEVLRSYLKDHPASVAQQDVLSKAGRQYRLAAYTLLLNRVGTSYGEIREARTGASDNRRALADRLGIELTEPRPPEDELDRLFLDARAPIGDPKEISEKALEGLFGLADTTRDPLSEGAKIGDELLPFPLGQIRRWNLNGVEWGRATDKDGEVYVSLQNPSANVFRVELFRDVHRTTLLASGELSTASGTVTLTPENNSGLSGAFDVAFTGQAANIKIAALPAFLSWRLRHLRSLWEEEDRPDDAYTGPSLPLIDPDLIGPDDFRAPDPASKPFAIWLERRQLVDARLKSLKTSRGASGLASLLTAALGASSSVMDALLADLTQSTDPQRVQQAKAAVNALNLSVESFTRLMAIRTKDQQAASDPRNEKVSDTEWGELYSLLAQAEKLKLFPAWRQKEQSAGVLLGQRDFWISLREPMQGDWPPQLSKDRPLIDPDALLLSDLPDTTAGKDALALWSKRRDRVLTINAALQAARRGATGFDAMLPLAFGLAPDLTKLNNDLASSNASIAANALKTITNDLHLTLDSFARLIAIRSKDKSAAAANKPTDAEWVEVCAILTQAQKEKLEFPLWITEEKLAGMDVAYWRALKMRLPQWRGTVEARRTWQQALRLRSQSPIIDPDVVDAEYIRDAFTGKAYQLWTKRTDWVNTILAGPRGTTLLAFDGALRTHGLDASDLLQLDTERTLGHSLEARLEQLNLSASAFSYLLRVRGLMEKNPILDSEWEDVYSILAQVQKVRQFAAWREAEKIIPLNLSPDFFQFPELPPPQFPPTAPPTLPAGRVTSDARRKWQDVLQSRIDQQQGVTKAVQEAVGVTEEATFPGLRDSLLAAMEAVGADFDTTAKSVTRNLLIDAKDGGCHITTRVAQAIETIQNLLWSLRTSQLPSGSLMLTSTNFDEEWKSIGAYAPWRAAVFVSLYPENILLPTLRPARWQTPGFRQLVDNLPTTGRLTPDAACAAATAYADYFTDVCNLRVEATCQTWTQLYRGTGCRGRSPFPPRYLFYMFARGAQTNRVYWSAYDPEDDSGSGYAQTFWKEVAPPGGEQSIDNVVRLIGAVPYQVASGKRYICLFAQTHDTTVQKLVVLRFDLESQEWEAETHALALPPDTFSFIGVIRQYATETAPPCVGIQVPNGAIYSGDLDKDGTGWANSEPHLLWSATGHDLLAMVEPGSVVPFLLVKRRADDTLIFVRIDGGGGLAFTGGDSHCSYHGIVGLPPFSFFTFADRNGNPETLRDFGGLTGAGIPEIDDVVPTAGSILSRLSRQFVYQRRFVPRFGQGLTSSFKDRTLTTLSSILSSSGATQVKVVPPPKFFRCTFDFADPDLNLAATDPIAPSVTAPLDIPTYSSAADLQERRKWIKQAFDENLGEPASLLTYLEEAYYFVPMHLALQLQRAGNFMAALDLFRTVYDYTAPEGQRTIYYGLELEQTLPQQFQRAANWLLDPLNPHAVAVTRANTYTRFTLLSIIRCLLDYADSEFSQDTSESLPRARSLYQTALDLLDTPVLKQTLNECEDIIGTLPPVADAEPAAMRLLSAIKDQLAQIPDVTQLTDTVKQLREVLGRKSSPERQFAAAGEILTRAQAGSLQPRTLGTVLRSGASLRAPLFASVLANPEVSKVAETVGSLAGADFQRAVATAMRISVASLDKGAGELPWLRGQTAPATAPKTAVVPAVRAAAGGNRNRLSLSSIGLVLSTVEPVSADPATAAQNASELQAAYAPSISGPGFCIPPNAVLTSLRLHAELDLYKLRTCRNIAGVVREIEPYSAATTKTDVVPAIGVTGRLTSPGAVTIHPTLYRYGVLVERAKQLVQLAAEVEAAMLSALQRRDDEAYSVLKAHQDLGLAQAGSRLQDLRLTEADDNVDLASLQQGQAQIRAKHYDDLLQDSTSEVAKLEAGTLESYQQALGFLEAVSRYNFHIAMFQRGGSYFDFFLTQDQLEAAAGNGAAAAIPVASSAASVYAGLAGIKTILASLERRKQEWQFQQQVAQQDVLIGQQQVVIAKDDVKVVAQEGQIAALQVQSASDTLEFLANKFTNVELYDWMSNTLERVYSFFLQQATAMAKLAENQLAFERQETPSAFIKADYWQAPNESDTVGSSTTPATNRRGLTGSARLLQDIYELDLYALETDKRKLQLSKTISLALLAPAEFQRFRETGVMLFATPMDIFDRDFPGHYLRLIKRVRTSVIALIPPTLGIHATLSGSGLSRVIIGGDLFQSVLIRRDPEYVALSSPINASGLFDLDPQSDMLLPFEGGGVDTTWEFRMPKPANLFDYRTIADVLITIDYTALNSFDYRQQIIQTLNPAFSADRPFSFRNHFADQWYDLNNPDQTATPMTVRFVTVRDDFPPNLDELKIQQIILYFARADGNSFEVPVNYLRFAEQGSSGPVGGGATSIDGVISTRRGNAGSWTSMLGKSPIGEWELALPTDALAKQHFRSEEIEDILFVITYSGRTPAWPS